ncbi:partitioning defective 3 homolog B-like [Stigmatopora nigra]
MLGLLITNIEEHSRTKTENIFQENECIVQINGVQLQDKAFADSQEVFREALLSPSMQLEVVPVSNKSSYEKGLIGQLFNGDGKAKSPSLARAKVDLKANWNNMAAVEIPEPLQPNPTSNMASVTPSNRNKMEPKPDRAPTRHNMAAVEIPEPLHPNAASISSSNRGKIEPKPDRVTNRHNMAAEIAEPLHPEPLHPNPTSVTLSNRGKMEPKPDQMPTRQNTVATAEIPEPLHPYTTSNPPSIAPTPRGKTELKPARQNTATDIPEPLQPEHSPLAALNRADLPSKKGGKKIKIDLTKGAEGLGFTVVTRDSLTSWPGPILVKNILPRGAAVKDGRLQPGDRILEVNGMDMSGRSQEELVAMLRSTRQGQSVCVTVSRQDDVFFPREMKGEDGVGVNVALEDGRERLTYEIPLNDTPSAGLGVSLKGNKSRETGEDLGIFIKSVIHGGAAHKDGRLKVNDQLIWVNGEALLGRSNHAAMDTLRRSMSAEGSGRGSARGSVRLVLLRSSAPEAPSDAVNAAIQRATRQRPSANQGSSGPAHFHDKYGRDDLLVNHRDDDFFANGQSKSMDLVVDEGNLRSLAGHQRGPTEGGGEDVGLGPTLGLWKSSSLESLQSAISEVRHHQRVPFHRPRPQVVRGRGCNQSFRIAIDKSYEGPFQDDDDDERSEASSGRETPASGSSRQDLDVVDVEDGKKTTKSANGRKREKKSKAKKKSEDEKSRKKGFGLLRFGKKKEASKMTKQNMDAFPEEEVDGFLDDRDRDDPRYARVEAGPRHALTDSGPRSLPNLREEQREPNYAQIEHFRQPDSLPPIGRDASPGKGRSRTRRAAAPDDLEALYAKVNKSRQPVESDGQPIATRRDYPPPSRAAPAYEELDAATRRFPDDDPHRVFARGAESRAHHLYEELDRPHAGRDPGQPRPTRRDPLPYSEHERSRASSSDRLGRRRYETVADVSRYGDATPPQTRRKNPVIGAV